jgi:putative ABC transport system permease protein
LIISGSRVGVATEGKRLSKLNRKLVRDLLTHWAQVGAITVVVALGVIMFSGPLLAQRDLRDSVNAIYRRTRYEDFSASVDSAPASAVARLASMHNMKAIEGRLVRDLLATVKGRQLTLRLISVPDAGRPAVNDLIVESGRYPPPGETGICLAEHHLTTEYMLRSGDTVTVNNGAGEVRLSVAGSVVSPEYLRLVRSRAEYVSDPAQFGVIFMRYSEVRRLLGAGDTFNNFVARVRAKGLLGPTMESARVLLTPYNVTGLTAAAEEPSAVTLDREIVDIGKLAIFFAVLLLAVASLALYITMTQIVFSQQREIGVTRALGYSRRTVSLHYLGYGAVLGTAGGALGVVLGYGLSRLLISIYAGIFALPFISTSLYAGIALAGLAVGVAFATAGALVPARHAVRMKPADAMRVEAGLALAHLPHTFKPGPLRTLGAPAWLRLSLRNLLRNRRRTLLTCLGVIGTVCLLVTAAGGKDSLDHSVDKYLNGVLRWDLGAQWQGVAGAETLNAVRAIDGVTVAEPLIDAPALVVFRGRSADVQVQAFGRHTVLHGSYPTPGSKAQPGAGEVLLNRGIQNQLPVKTGDTVTLSTPLGRLPFKVAGFVSEPFGGVCYVNLEYVQSVALEATGVANAFNAVVVRARPGSAPEVASALRELTGVSQVLTKAGILKVFDELVGAVRALFLIFYVMAFAMGFAILFSMTTVNLLERSREAATIRTLGAGRSRIFSFVTVENVAVVLAALIPGILLGRLLEWFVIEKLLSSERLAPDAVISAVTLVGIVAASLVVVVLSELPSIVRLWHLDLGRVTRERAD